MQTRQFQRTQRMLANVSIAAFVSFLCAATVIQALHIGGFASAPISAYLRGPNSGWLQAGYYMLSVGLVLLGLCLLMLRPRRRHIVAAAVLVIAGCAVTLVAYTYSPWPMPGNPGRDLRESIHVKSAFVAFLGVTTVMFIETPLLWHGRTRTGVLLFALLVLVVELASTIGPQYTPGLYGALEKLAIVGLVSWLIACAAQFARPSNRPTGGGGRAP